MTLSYDIISVIMPFWEILFSSIRHPSIRDSLFDSVKYATAPLNATLLFLSVVFRKSITDPSTKTHPPLFALFYSNKQLMHVKFDSYASKTTPSPLACTVLFR